MPLHFNRPKYLKQILTLCSWQETNTPPKQGGGLISIQRARSIFSWLDNQKASSIHHGKLPYLETASLTCSKQSGRERRGLLLLILYILCGAKIKWLARTCMLPGRGWLHLSTGVLEVPTQKYHEWWLEGTWFMPAIKMMISQGFNGPKCLFLQ